MRFLRWSFAIMMILLLFVARDHQNKIRSPQIIQPNYEQTSLQGRDFIYYTIQPGDTISLIERKFRVISRESILSLNPEIDPDRLPVKRRIKIPLQ